MSRRACLLVELALKENQRNDSDIVERAKRRKTVSPPESTCQHQHGVSSFSLAIPPQNEDQLAMHEADPNKNVTPFDLELHAADTNENAASLDFDSDDSVKDPDYQPERENQKFPSSIRLSECYTTAETDHENEVTEDTIILNNDEQHSETPEQNPAVRKKRSRKDRQVNSELRNKGKSYITGKGKEMKAREIIPLKPCRMKCLERFKEEDRKKCFEEYWDIGNHDNRIRYISSLIKTSKPKTHRVTEDSTKLREIVCKYELIINGNNEPICRECFRRTFGETTGFIECVASNRKNVSTGIIAPDGRGKSVPANKTAEEKLQIVRAHILSFPSYESHYCRNRTSKRFLSSDLCVSKMYDLYKECTETPVSLKIYTRCFNDLNLAFKKPKQDTCHKCDTLKMKIDALEGEAKDLAIQEREAHHKAAEESYDAKRRDKEVAQTSDKRAVFAFDLQQCLPTPYLTTSVSFYKRQLWTFNLTVHNLVTNEATCFMWDETTSGRGANEIASCLYEFVLQLPEMVEEIVFYSDSCGGQNRNSIVAAMFSFLIEKKSNIREIHHKFLVSGHTHMECDSDHAAIEREKKRTGMKINHPNDWYQLVRSCKRKKPFRVFVMEGKHFLDFSSLTKTRGPFVMKKTDTNGNKFLWTKTHWLKYTQESRKIYFKYSLSEEENFRELSIRRRGKILLPPSIPVIHDGPVPISTEKKKDILDLLPLIDSIFHDYYKNLKVDSVPNVDPDLEELNEDE